MKFDIRMLVLSTLLISWNAHAHVAIETVTTITSDGASLNSIDEVVDIFVEIITGKRDIVVFERIVSQVGDASLKDKLVNFFREIKKLMKKERINKLRIVACQYLGLGATASLTSKLLKVRKELNEEIFHQFVEISQV